MPSPRSRRLALATGLTYHVLEWGDPAAPPVVLIHGFLDIARAWAAVARRLAARFRVIAPDLRGHGDSDWIGPGGYYHFFDYVADVDDLVGRLGAPIGLVGHSMGGSVSSYLAGTRPDRIRKLALLEGLGPPEQAWPLPERAARWIDAWRDVRGKPLAPLPSIEAAAARMRKHDRLLDEAQALELARHGTRPVEGGVVWKHDPLHGTMGPYPFRVDVAEQFWRRIACPVLVVDGGDSTMRHGEAEAARRLACFRDARAEVIAGAGHAIQRHQPDALADLLLGFFGGHDNPP